MTVSSAEEEGKELISVERVLLRIVSLEIEIARS